jgi:soluble lytic murein transglycosylase-like protein
MKTDVALRKIGFAVLCTGFLVGGSTLAIQEWRLQKVEALASAAAMAASIDAQESRMSDRLARFFSKANPGLDKETALYLAYAVQEAANRYDLPEDILAGLIYTESRAVPEAVNKGCYGLTQVHWAVWASTLTEKHPEIFSKADLFEPRRSILAGAWILRHYLDRYGDMSKALRAYSGGARWYSAKVKNAAEGL